ncbi:hypothetical protein [Streptomyces sp. NPDC054940]
MGESAQDADPRRWWGLVIIALPSAQEDLGISDADRAAQEAPVPEKVA